ncbi:MFS transporter [Oligella urethralis]|uniref:MFS transporter n=1 Tax=Oligella urethralis TaxID=90245 RepID=UPI000CFEA603|nr:MFS transporter [Oligella urethralis]AVL70376.1 MFS transporter [Oligella urethralis]
MSDLKRSVQAQEKLSIATLLMLVLMSSVTFIAILSEMMPAGVLDHISEGLAISVESAGQMIGLYALASAIVAVPLVTATMRFNRKPLLLWLLFGFALSNIVVGFSSSYLLTLAMRLIGGAMAGILWAMITAYGMKIVSSNHHGMAIAIIMAGTTLGVSFGMPLMTWIGTSWGWRIEFFALGALIVGIMVLAFFFLPSVPGEQVTQENNPLSLLKNKHVLNILLLTLLGVMAHYAVYTYITQLVDRVNVPGGIEMALLLFGIGSFISIMLAMRFTDTSLRRFTSLMFLLGALGLGMLYFIAHYYLAAYIAFFLWGISFGPLVTMLQTAVASHSESAKAIATSVQSSMFNFSILLATSFGGFLLAHANIMAVVMLAVILLAAATMISFISKGTLGEQ